jgi:hypothetical protein
VVPCNFRIPPELQGSRSQPSGPSTRKPVSVSYVFLSFFCKDVFVLLLLPVSSLPMSSGAFVSSHQATNASLPPAKRPPPGGYVLTP